MREIRKLAVQALAILLLAGTVWAADPTPPTIPEGVIDWGLYVAYTDKDWEIAWDKVNQTEITGYEMWAYNMERKAFLVKANVPQRDAPSVTVKLAKPGHYVFFARSINANATEEDYEYSDWSCSVTATDVLNGQKFWVYTYLAPPTDVTIE
jgi:hypothetical protein